MWISMLYHQFISLCRAQQGNISQQKVVGFFFLKSISTVSLQYLYRIFLINERQVLLIYRCYAVCWFQRSSLQNAKQKEADFLVCQDHFTFKFTISKVNLEQSVVCTRKYSPCGWNSHGYHPLDLLLWSFSPAPHHPFQHE